MEEVNQLLDLANQMGLIKGLYDQTVHNRTKCNTWNEIYDSHIEERGKIVLGFDAIRGLMILLVVGLSVALFIFIIEHMAHWTVQEQLVIEISVEMVQYFNTILQEGRPGIVMNTVGRIPCLKIPPVRRDVIMKLT